jgi:hypothetical protein
MQKRLLEVLPSIFGVAVGGIIAVSILGAFSSKTAVPTGKTRQTEDGRRLCPVTFGGGNVSPCSVG